MYHGAMLFVGFVSFVIGLMIRDIMFSSKPPKCYDYVLGVWLLLWFAPPLSHIWILGVMGGTDGP